MTTSVDCPAQPGPGSTSTDWQRWASECRRLKREADYARVAAQHEEQAAIIANTPYCSYRDPVSNKRYCDSLKRRYY